MKLMQTKEWLTIWIALSQTIDKELLVMHIMDKGEMFSKINLLALFVVNGEKYSQSKIKDLTQKCENGVSVLCICIIVNYEITKCIGCFLF